MYLKIISNHYYLSEGEEVRYSEQRNVILSVLQSSHSHLSVNSIYQEAKKAIPHISLGTVYRNLAQLADAGYVLKIKGLDCKTYYDKTEISHGHLFCNQCRQIFNIDYNLITQLQNVIAGEKKFFIERHNVLIEGTCSNCMRKKS